MDKHHKVFVAGRETLPGTAIVRLLRQQGYTNIVGEAGTEPDYSDPVQVETTFSQTRPDYVFLVAGESGGIAANQKYPALLMLDNLMVECNVINAAHRHGVRKLLYLASSCVYPRDCPQPMKEDALLTGHFEPTNEAYAVAKIAGIKLCQAYRQQYGACFISGIPANIFGPGDDFSPEESHVIPALIRRMQEAKVAGSGQVDIWGSGNPRREFIFVDDLADACIFVMNSYDGTEPINLGSGDDISIGQLAAHIKETVGYPGGLEYDSARPDGMPLKSLDSTKLAQLGWQPGTPLATGLAATYKWYLQYELEDAVHDGAAVKVLRQACPERSRMAQDERAGYRQAQDERGGYLGSKA